MKGFKKMKLTKVITMFFIAALSVYSNVYSQSTSMGIEGGLNLANISTTPSFNSGSKTGFMVGGFADIGVSRIMSIKPGVRYIMKGYTSQFLGGNMSETYSYIEIPLMIKAGMPLNHVKPYVEAGPTLGIQLSANQEYTFNGGGQAQEQDSSPFYSAIDFGLYFGSGIEFSVAHGTDLFTGFGYSLGLTNISKTTTSGKNHGFQITTGVKFSL